MLSLSIISVELLNDSRGVLDHLLVSLRRILGERLDNSANAHFFQSPTTLLINTEVANGKESDSSR